jgi:hypothetical protein
VPAVGGGKAYRSWCDRCGHRWSWAWIGGDEQGATGGVECPQCGASGAPTVRSEPDPKGAAARVLGGPLAMFFGGVASARGVRQRIDVDEGARTMTFDDDPPPPAAPPPVVTIDLPPAPVEGQSITVETLPGCRVSLPVLARVGQEFVVEATEPCHVEGRPVPVGSRLVARCAKTLQGELVWIELGEIGERSSWPTPRVLMEAQDTDVRLEGHLVPRGHRLLWAQVLSGEPHPYPYAIIVEPARPLHEWPAVRTQCTCGHSWLFHWLAEPHKCNDCETCPGYVPAPPAAPEVPS